ncbi:hypothetical protein BH18ACT12_BH18ACT12_18510 [soil metagenome]
MNASALLAARDAASARAADGSLGPERVHELLLRVLESAGAEPAVNAALSGVAAGRALLRFTDAPLAIEFQAGAGRIHAEPAEVRGKGPKVDASSATWLGLLGGTLRPWLAFTRGLVVCRAGLTELRWLQQVAERLQAGYGAARTAGRKPP